MFFNFATSSLDDICKARWNMIRSDFKKIIKKGAIRKHGAKCDKTCRYLKNLEFLKNYYEARKAKLIPIARVLPEPNRACTQNATTSNSRPAQANVQPVPVVRRTEVTTAYVQPHMHEFTGPRFVDVFVQPENTPRHPVDSFLAGIAPTLKMLSPYLLHLARSEIFAVVQKFEYNDQFPVDNYHQSFSSISTTVYRPVPSPDNVSAADDDNGSPPNE